MPVNAYIDSSALLKLVFREPETSPLEAHLATLDGLVASRLTVVESRRAARRAARPPALETLEEALGAIYLLDMTQAILDQAAMANPLGLRSLDAIHLATALSVGDTELELITYDARLAAAARSLGLTVVQPGL